MSRLAKLRFDVRWAGFLLCLALLALVAWAPWVSRGYAERVAVSRFEGAWRNVADGCGFNCQGCGAQTALKVPFGYTVALEYACGMRQDDTPKYHRKVQVFVSALGTVHGIPRP